MRAAPPVLGLKTFVSICGRGWLGDLRSCQGLSHTAQSHTQSLPLTDPTVRADKATHVLDNTQHLAIHLPAEVDLLPHGQQGHFLRGGNYYGTINTCIFQELHNGDVLVTGAGRGVHNEVVEVTPIGVLQKLLDQGCEKRESAQQVWHR